jgi:hypothetical protein
VDGDAHVVIVGGGFDKRERGDGRISGDDDFDPGALAVVEFGADVGGIVFGEINCAGGA